MALPSVFRGHNFIEVSAESLDIERFHSRRAILDIEQVAPLVDGGGGSSERLQWMENPFRELVNVLSWIHDGRLFIVSDTYVGNFQTTILVS